ncbi:MAG: hypothetical protein ACREAB_21160, partial [Blastocatellia bacterium]
MKKSIPSVFTRPEATLAAIAEARAESLSCETCPSVAVGNTDPTRQTVRRRHFIRLIINNSIAVIPVRRLSFHIALFAGQGARWSGKSQQNEQLNST